MSSGGLFLVEDTSVEDTFSGVTFSVEDASGGGHSSAEDKLQWRTLQRRLSRTEIVS